MRFIIILFVLYTTTVENEIAAQQNYLDLNDGDANVVLWKNLFIKLNALIAENEKLRQGLVNINHRLDHLTKRLDAQEIGLNQPWTSILRRQDDTVNFYRGWKEYREGFGDPHGNFFLGLQRLHALTTQGPPQELLIVLKDFDNQTRYAKYDLFRIGSENEKYALTELGPYSGDAGDALRNHIGHKFSTFDMDNDSTNDRNCAVAYEGAWWFGNCYSGHLNGPYRNKMWAPSPGISWDPWKGWNYSVKYAEMMIRPKLQLS